MYKEGNVRGDNGPVTKLAGALCSGSQGCAGSNAAALALFSVQKHLKNHGSCIFYLGKSIIGSFSQFRVLNAPGIRAFFVLL